MSKKDEALKLALEALKANVIGTSGRMPKTHEAITALREALEKAELHKLASDSLTEGLRLDDWNKIGCVNHDCDKCKTLAEQPAQQEPCGGCGGSGWVTRDPDIGTDQECFVCDGKGTVEPEQPAQQEPVAWGIIASNTGRICQVELDADEVEGYNQKHIVPLYTSPPAQRTWVGLTDEERQSCTQSPFTADNYRAIEAKLKEKNT